jgi:chaperonin cofactor prefoldin
LVGVQELKKENEDLKKTVSVQNDKLDRLEKELNEMKKKIDKTM